MPIEKSPATIHHTAEFLHGRLAIIAATAIAALGASSSGASAHGTQELISRTGSMLTHNAPLKPNEQAQTSHDTPARMNTEPLATSATAQRAQTLTFIAGRGMTQAYLATIQRAADESFLWRPKGVFTATLGQTNKECVDASSPNRVVANLMACVNPSTNVFHFNPKMPVETLAHNVNHEELHESISRFSKEKDPSITTGDNKLVRNVLIHAKFANSAKQADKLITHGPQIKGMSKATRSIWSEETTAEIGATCAQNGFYLSEGANLDFWIAEDAWIRIPGQLLPKICRGIQHTLASRPQDFARPTQTVPKEPIPLDIDNDYRQCGVRPSDQLLCQQLELEETTSEAVASHAGTG